MTGPKLDPCPFCGSADTHLEGVSIFNGSCAGCNAGGPLKWSAAEAAAAWNARATEASLRAALEEIHRLSLVIESAVRNADRPNYPAVNAALHATRRALQPEGKADV